ncbi:MAG: ComEC family competence protein [Candidatus Omnitrophica bacterium ADurb.Bin277]|nr:MAG: ComEC family competence protein [Candidatus Omnitrophica bacterium ADurb.Bin277]
MVAGSFYLFFILAGLRRSLAVILTMMVTAGYVVLSGAGIPVRRAGLMAVMVLGAVLLNRGTNSLNILGASFFLMLVQHPKDLWNIGFQLSYLSVFSLIVLLPLLPRHRILSLSIGGSLAVLAGTFPLVLYYFNVFSPVGVLANVVAIPAFDMALFLSFFSLPFSGIPLLGGLLTGISSLAVKTGLFWIERLARYRLGYWFFVKPGLRQLLGYYALLVALIALGPGRFPKKKWIVGGALCLFFLTGISMLKTDPAEGFRLTVLATGRDPVTHIRFSNGENWLVNTGRNFPSDQGERIVLPYLRKRGIKSLQGIILTDFYKKHTGGMFSILRNIPVREIVVPEGRAFPDEWIPFREKIRRLRDGSRIGCGRETMMFFTDKGKATVSIETGGRKIVFLFGRSPEFVESGKEHNGGIYITPYMREKPPVFFKGPLPTWILPGGEPAALEELKKQGGRMLLLPETGALDLSVSAKKFRVFPCAIN